LGLAITKYLCEAMDGNISVQSVYGSGSTFTIRLPVPGGTDMHSEGESTDAEAGAFTSPGAKVLVVDDIEINLMVAQAVLETYGIDADLAASGEEALERIGKIDYDLILMDQMMPGMDGVEATRRIRAHSGHYQTVPVIALTANAFADDETKACFNDFLIKPLSPDLLEQCLKKWLRR
jgi:CheY-like chemotaxis protein